MSLFGRGLKAVRTDLAMAVGPVSGSEERWLCRALWSTVCRHLDGVAVGSTVAALGRYGVLDRLVASPGISFGRLHREVGGNAGYLGVALRLLACQGWLQRQGPPGSDAMACSLTPDGRHLPELAPFYQRAADILPAAQELLAARDDETLTAALAEIVRRSAPMRRAWDLPSTGLPRLLRLQACDHLDGHVMAPVLALLALRDGLGDPAAAADMPAAEIPRPILDLLAVSGWAQEDGGPTVLTRKGLAGLRLARQYWYPMSYLATLVRVPELLFGEARSVLAQDGVETHVDRGLDIRFSGGVFEKTCRQPFLDLALPLFERTPLDTQPVAVVDTGCGNGALLRALYHEVRLRTLRGRHLDSHPLLMVGGDPSAVARAATAAQLAADDVPHWVMESDITDPEGIARGLSARGVEPHRALHVSKSVIHNRRYRPPPPDDEAGPPARTSGAFVAPDGSRIANADLERDLVEHFRSWTPLCREHGLLVIEAHTAPPEITARQLGSNVTTLLDATHGYSRQYLVEPQLFLDAARRAGFHPLRHKSLGKEMMGYSTLTLTHFVIDQST